MTPKLIVRCSSLGRIMAAGKPGAPLSAGAKTFVEEKAKEHVYGFTNEVSTKEMQKGLIVEPEAIKLYNEVFFQNYTKNTERRQNDHVGGTPDVAADLVVDFKSSWSLKTFPARPEDGENPIYEWQIRGYMWLFDKPAAYLSYCMVDTPAELAQWESDSLHSVSHIAPELRITRLHFERSAKDEALIKLKVEAAQAYFQDAVSDILNHHN